MQVTKLKITYNGGQVNIELDKAIEVAVKPFGYLRWASGYNIETGWRDIVFNNKEEDVKNLNEAL